MIEEIKIEKPNTLSVFDFSTKPSEPPNELEIAVLRNCIKEKEILPYSVLIARFKEALGISQEESYRLFNNMVNYKIVSLVKCNKRMIGLLGVSKWTTYITFLTENIKLEDLIAEKMQNKKRRKRND